MCSEWLYVAFKVTMFTVRYVQTEYLYILLGLEEVNLARTAFTGPEDSRRLRPTDFKIFGT
jgi:hypothetical protein